MHTRESAKSYNLCFLGLGNVNRTLVRLSGMLAPSTSCVVAGLPASSSLVLVRAARGAGKGPAQRRSIRDRDVHTQASQDHQGEDRPQARHGHVQVQGTRRSETISKIRQILANRPSIADLFGPHLTI